MALPADITMVDAPEESFATEEPEAPASREDNDAFLMRVKDWFRADREHSAEWRKEAEEDFDFVAGNQWSDEDKTLLREQMRPEITFNRTTPTIEAVAGLEVGNRREVRFIPREQGDVRKNEILTAAAQWFRDECDAEDEESDAFFDTVVCGMGWTDTRLEFEDDPEGTLQVDRLDPLEMYWDKSARKRNLVDARRMWRVRSMPLSEAKDMFPDVDPALLDAAWARGEKGNADEPHDADPTMAYQQDDLKVRGYEGREVTIVHVQWWEKEPYYRVAFNGRVEEVEAVDFPKFKDRADQLAAAFPGQMQPMQSVRQMRRKYYQAFVGSDVLDRGDSPVEGHFSWECITGKRDHNKGTWFGLVRPMKDPQRWANKWLSQSLHILNSNAKGGIFAEHGAFEDDREAEESFSSPDRITWLKPNGIAKIQPKNAPQFPAGFAQLMEFAVTSMRDATGVNLELLGMRDANQPGVLEEHRKQAGMTILAVLFDSLRRYRKRQGRILLYYIQNYLSDGRLIRIVGKDQEQYLPLLKEEGVAAYDIIVDDMPTSPNQKEKIWTTLTQMLPMVGPMLGPEEWLALAKYSPLPESVVQELGEGAKQKMQAQAQQQQTEKQKMEQLRMEQHQLAMRKVMSEITENEADAQKKQADTQKVQAETAHQQIETQILPLTQPLLPGRVNVSL